jgi:myosin protein heavy chain
MSVWKIGMNEVTEETQAFKNKLSSKGVYSENPKLFLTGLDLFLESQIAAQQNEILKQAAELAELKTTLNETLHKVCLVPPSICTP